MRQRTWALIKWLSLAVSVASIVLAGVLMWLAAPPDTEKAQQQTSVQTRVENPTIVERNDGRIVWQLKAGEARQQLNGRMHLQDPELILFTETGRRIPIRSREAWFNPLRRNIHFQGQVRVDYIPWVLHCEQLTYQSRTDQILIPDTFTLSGQSLRATGRGMRIDRTSERIHVDHGIRIDDSAPEWTGSGL